MDDRKGISPQDALPDHENFAVKNGHTIRKGTMAAALMNADILSDEHATSEEKEAALNAIREIAPQLKGIGLLKHLSWKNPKIQAIFEEI